MKRYIRSSYEGDEYTSLINLSTNPDVDFVVNADIEDIDVDTLESAIDCFFEDLHLLPSDNTMDSLDYEYDKDKGKIYKKYRPLIDKCKELLDYYNKGTNSSKNLYEKQLIKKFDYIFPYGWKRLAKLV